MNRREKISTHFMNKELTMTLLSTGTDYDALAAAFRPIFTRIAQGAAEREQQRILPDEPIRWLKEAGFGTLRIPREKGGWGASLPQLSALLIELAQADSNLPQALRAHFAFVEDQLNQPDSAGRDRWFRRFLDGELVGSGWTEIGAVKLGEVNTRVTPAEGGWRLDGEKFYSTGALYADWIDVFARRSDTASDVIALVSTQQTGVVREDDWDGFGQRLTGSGTTRFTGARVETEHVYDFAQRFRYQTAFYQHVLLATLAGIGLAVERNSVFTFFKKSSVKSASLATMTSFTLFFSSSSSVNSASPSSQQMTRLFPSFAKPCSNKVSLMREVFPLSIKPVNKYTGISFIYILPY